MGGFPALRRDVLRWLITLNLSQPIKNVRRDFSNGFLIAEIFSQYCPQDIQMHSFDNGTKLAKKQDNWAQLEKVFKKKDFPLVPGEIDNIINCGPEDGIGPFLERMYWFLARKSSKPQEPHIQDLWTGLPDNTDVSLLPNADCKARAHTEDISFFDELQSSISGCFSRPAAVPSLSLGNKASITFTASLPSQTRSATPQKTCLHCDTARASDTYDTSDRSARKHGSCEGSSVRKKTLNAVERARQKEMKELSKSAKVQQKQNPYGQDPRLAFRSPNRQRNFKSYTLMDYKRQQALGYVMLGKLGPHSTEELRAKRETLEKMKEFGRSARSIVASHSPEPRKPIAKPPSTRAKALKFASTVPKPKRKDEHKVHPQENHRPAVQPLTELEILEAKYRADKQHLEAMRKDLEIFLR